MKKHSDNVYVVGKAVHALASFAATSMLYTYKHACIHTCIHTYIHTHTHTYIHIIHVHTHTYTRTAVDDTGLKKSQAYIHVVEALKKHPSEAGIQSGGLLTLAHTLQTDLYTISNLLLRGDHSVILDALRAHPSNAMVVAHGCKALHAVTVSEEGCEVLRACGTLQLAVDVLDQFGEKALVVCAALGLIDGLTAESEGGGRGEGKGRGKEGRRGEGRGGKGGEGRGREGRGREGRGGGRRGRGGEGRDHVSFLLSACRPALFPVYRSTQRAAGSLQDCVGDRSICAGS